MVHAPAKCSFAGIANITCGSSRGKDNFFFVLNKCVVQVKNHLRSCSLSHTKVTQYDLILARVGKFNLLSFTVKNQLTGKWCVQEIARFFFTLVLVRSRKYFQLFCFNSCPFFLSKNWLGIEADGKKDKKENSNFASLCSSSSQRSRVSRNVYYTMTIP